MIFRASMLTLTVLMVLSCAPLQTTDRPVPYADEDGRYVKWEADGVFVSVHRTMGSRAAENSIEAIRECYLAGGDAIDCDLRFTSDRVVVTIHDDQPKGWSRPVSQMAWAEVKKLDLEPSRFPGQKVPRFEDVVRHALANNMAIYLDEKIHGAKKKAMDILSRYDAMHLVRWPCVPTVYYWNQHKDNDPEYLKPLFGKVKGHLKPGFMAGCQSGPVLLEPGDPRHFRCNDPTVIVALAGRTSDVIKDRGAYRPPVPEQQR